MSEPEVSALEGSAAPNAPEDAGRTPRSAVLRFVITFVLLVMTFLVGYRYAMDTRANIWYLFQVAKHTAWALRLVGDSAGAEPFSASDPASHRAELNQWRAERRGGTESEQMPQGPLSPWESWQWKAYSTIRDGGTIANDGPLVQFVLKRGLAGAQEEVRRELDRLSVDARKTGADHSAEIATLEKKLEGIVSRLNAIPQGAERNVANRGEQFSFHVVPDCGAIPSMSIFFAAVLAFPAPWWKRIAGGLTGMTVLYGVNIVRLASLGYIGAIDSSPGRKWFTFVHEYVWQGIFIVFVVAVWMMWIEWFVRPRRS